MIPPSGCCTCGTLRAKRWNLRREKSKADVESDEVLLLALTHLLELVGEAAAHVPQEIQAKYPGVPWPKIVNMRNRLIHGYDYIDYNIVWDAVTRNLPEMLKELDTGKLGDATMGQ